jgi:beta-glucosidase
MENANPGKYQEDGMNKKRMFSFVVFVCAAAALAIAALPARLTKSDDIPAWKNPALPVEARVNDLLSRLTLEEKVSLLVQTEVEIPRLGIPHYHFGNEALHGVVRPGSFTVFPMAIALAATWDTDLIHTVATAISDEARGKYNANGQVIDALYSGLLAFWSPTINMARDPRWGRTPETYGEDPYLTGRIGVSFVTGLQGDDPRYIKVVSTPKHFAANNEEHNRFECNAKISQRTLREYYFPAFRACVTEGNAQSVMAAYNAINGVPCAADPWLLTDVLRGDWGFDGYVVSDCGAVGNIFRTHGYAKNATEAAAFAVKAGIDLECGDSIMKTFLIPAMKQGLVTEADIDRAAFRVLRARFRLGMFDPLDLNPYTKIPGSAVGSKEHQALARQTARKSIVLIKNEPVNGKPLLPIDDSKVKTIAVVGPNAPICRFGDYSGTPVNEPVSPAQGITARAGGKVKIKLVDWIGESTAIDYTTSVKGQVSPPDAAPGTFGFKGEYFNNSKFSGAPVAVRVDPAVDIDKLNKPPDPAIPYGKFSARWTGKLTPKLSGEHGFAVTVEGSARLYLDGKLLFEQSGKKIQTFKSGESLNLEKAVRNRVETLTANADLEAGRTYDIALEYVYVDGNAKVDLKLMFPSADKEAALAAGLDTMKNSDLVIAFLGIGLDQEREGIDRKDLDLPHDQEEFIEKAYAANPNLVVVMISGSPMSINWIAAHAHAIVDAWYPGEQGGNAIADVLFGDYNPAGRLPFTFYKSVGQLPPFDDYEVPKGRTYMYFEGEPIWAFGHGISYTKFEYSNLRLGKKTARASDAIEVSFDVRNTGGMDGEEVPQLYVRDVESSVKQPIKMLRGFRRVSIKKGATATVTIPLAIADIGYWDEKAHAFAVEPGDFEIEVGASSADIRLKDRITVVK